ncbi:hypothetical protein GCM10008957_30060 [Deinococcus ruber]|uniref:Uncharacterized protein n=1 Tax=Deinococcus ruber TaxID=1848197 RepID=A0A918CDD7_9DEIO|nr:hypothetical protein GCM10008957_30060 [Deinococcus ruber]
MKLPTLKRTIVATLVVCLSTGALAGNGGDVGVLRASRITTDGNGGDVGLLRTAAVTTEAGK